MWVGVVGLCESAGLHSEQVDARCGDLVPRVQLGVDHMAEEGAAPDVSVRQAEVTGHELPHPRRLTGGQQLRLVGLEVLPAECADDGLEAAQLLGEVAVGDVAGDEVHAGAAEVPRSGRPWRGRSERRAAPERPRIAPGGLRRS